MLKRKLLATVALGAALMLPVSGFADMLSDNAERTARAIYKDAKWNKDVLFKTDEAIKGYREVLAIDKEYPMPFSMDNVYTELSELLFWKKGDNAGVVALLTKQLNDKRSVRLTNAYYYIGFVHELEGRDDQAVEFLSKALEDKNIERDFPGVLLRLGRSYGGLKQWALSEKYLKRYLSTKGHERAMGNRDLAKALSYNKKHDEALLAIEMAIKLEPKNAYGLWTKGFVLEGSERFEEAVTAYKIACDAGFKFACEQDWGIREKAIFAKYMKVRGDYKSGFGFSTGTVTDAYKSEGKAVFVIKTKVEGKMEVYTLIPETKFKPDQSFEKVVQIGNKVFVDYYSYEHIGTGVKTLLAYSMQFD